MVALPQRFRRQSNGTKCDIQTQPFVHFTCFSNLHREYSISRMGWSALSGVTTEFAGWDRVGKGKGKVGSH